MGALRLAIASGLFVSTIAACTVESEEFSCSDPKYGNGTCDLDTTCGAPDIDCFVTFDTAQAASEWYSALPAAASRGAAIPVDDVRFAPTQALIDEGWEAYKQQYEVGELATKQVQLVLVDNEAVNAFVAPDQERVRAGLAVMVNTGLINAGATKAQVLGVIMHEFEHAAALHVNPTVKAGLLHYYATPADSESLGYQQVDDAGVRALYEQWEAYQQFAGYASDAELGGLPLAPISSMPVQLADKYGLMSAFFIPVLAARAQALNTTACTNAVNQYVPLHNQVLATLSPLDDDVTSTTSQRSAIVTALTTVRDQCWTGYSGTTIQLLAAVTDIPEADLRAKMPADMEMSADGGTVITGWYNAINTARARMREIEAMYMTQFGAPWSRLRQFTTEEAADDSSARIMIAMGLDADGLAQLLVGANAPLAAKCDPLVAAGTPVPYGQNLADAHHATCWRQQHQRAIAANPSARKIQWQPISTDQPIHEPLISVE